MVSALHLPYPAVLQAPLGEALPTCADLESARARPGDALPPRKDHWVRIRRLDIDTIAGLTAGWEQEYTDFRGHDLSGRDGL